MINQKIKKIGTIALAASISISCMLSGSVSAATPSGNYYQDQFTEQYEKIKAPANGYFNSQGIPYHSVETILCEAPDYGHESTSEAVSYYIWLEAMNGKFTGDYSGVTKAWDTVEKYFIPATADQPAGSRYTPNKPATYAPEFETPNQYPAQLDSSAPVGPDPIDAQLKAAYGSSNMYGMHWLIDVDNWYGYGVRGTGTGSPVYINSFQRGEQESCFETITQPCWDAMKFGGRNGYLDLFTKDASYAQQYKYTDAPDADARAIQATYDAYKWAKAAGKTLDTAVVAKASKMGDYLRYAMFDKYFRKIGASTQAGTGYDAATYLLSWYYAWGGDASSQAGWAWKISASHNHQAYQSPLAAWILSNPSNAAFKPKSSGASADWDKSLGMQLDFYTWLQAPSGAIAGGATNSWNGRYEAIPAGVPTFNGMGYVENPVYADPGSNTWMGFQAWPMQRVAQYYYETKDPKAKELVTRWGNWASASIKFDDVKETFQIPSTIKIGGKPDTWTGARSANAGLTTEIINYGMDLGVAGSLANALSYIAAANNDTALQAKVKKLLNYMANCKDSKGIALPESRADYTRLNDKVYVPAGWTGTMPNGDVINSSSTFLSIRSNYKKDPDWARVEAALNAGQAPVFTYHRFWGQSDIAIAFGIYATLFPDDKTRGPITDKLLGDVDGDTIINALDFAKLKMYLLNPATVINVPNSDINEDGDINAIDYALLKQKLLTGV